MSKWALTLSFFLSSASIAKAEPAAQAGSLFAIPGVYLFLLAILALIVAFAIVGSMKAKMKTADKQARACHYIREGSFALQKQSDRFLYEKEERRKIETKAPDNQSQKG